MPMKDIMKLHYLGVSARGLKFRDISCIDCLGRSSECEQCSELPVFKTPDEVQQVLAKEVEDEDEDQSEEVADDAELVEESDSDSEDDSCSEEEGDEVSEELAEGCYVWAPFGRRQYPAQIVSLASVPQDLQKQLATKKAGQVCVRWIGEVDSKGQPVDRFSSVSVDRLKLLGDEAVDQSLATRCPM